MKQFVSEHRCLLMYLYTYVCLYLSIHPKAQPHREPLKVGTVPGSSSSVSCVLQSLLKVQA